MEAKLAELKDTVDGMLSGDYRERFAAEYHQVRIRLAKLNAFVAKIKSAKEKGEPEPKHDCPLCILEAQADAMAEYRSILEARAKEYEGIDLNA